MGYLARKCFYCYEADGATETGNFGIQQQNSAVMGSTSSQSRDIVTCMCYARCNSADGSRYKSYGLPIDGTCYQGACSDFSRINGSGMVDTTW